jgi:hypothetical protein
MKKTVELKKDEDGNNYFDLQDISDLFDIEKIDSYQIEETDHGITVAFFDKDGNPVLPTER